jgi:Phospholipase_D-nuclease N-terminal
MLLAVVLFGLVTVGFVVPCLIDVAVTPSTEIRSLSKPVWILLIAAFSVFGATAWLAAGRPDRRRRTRLLPRYLEGAPSMGQQDALRRHPAGRAMDPGLDGGADADGYHSGPLSRGPIGPDDDPEFMEELARRVQGGREAGNDL